MVDYILPLDYQQLTTFSNIMNIPKPKRKAMREQKAKSIAGKQSANKIKGYKIQTQLVKKISEGVTDTNKLVSAAAQDAKSKRSEVKKIMEENASYVEQTTNEVLSLMAKNALAVMEHFDPLLVQNSYRPLTAAILTDKLLKLREALGTKSNISPQETLLKFCADHNIGFQELKLLVHSNKLPDNIPTDTLKQLQAIIKNLPPKTLDVA